MRYSLKENKLQTHADSLLGRLVKLLLWSLTGPWAAGAVVADSGSGRSVGQD